MATETLCVSFTRTDFPFTQNGYRYEKLGGPFSTSGVTGCLSCGGCSNGNPRMSIRISWSYESVACRKFFGVIYRNGDTHNICPDSYKASKLVTTYNVRTPGGGLFRLQRGVFATHSWNVSSGELGMRSLATDVKTYNWGTSEHLHVTHGLVVAHLYDATYGDWTNGNGGCTVFKADLGLCTGCSMRTPNQVGIGGCLCPNQYTYPDPDFSGETITISWEKGPGDWSLTYRHSVSTG